MKLEGLIYDYIHDLEKALHELRPVLLDAQIKELTFVEWKAMGEERVLRKTIHNLLRCLAQAEDIKGLKTHYKVEQ